MPEAIANTSPLQYLHQIECLELLPKLLGRITVAGAVVSELKAGRHLGLNLPAPEELPWVDVREPISPAGVLSAWDLGAGESASLSLAVERPGSWLILDDRRRSELKTPKIPLDFRSVPLIHPGPAQSLAARPLTPAVTGCRTFNIDGIQTSALIRTRRAGRLSAGREAFLP